MRSIGFVVATLVMALLSGFSPARADGQRLPLERELAVGADYCAILRAFTELSDPRCPDVELGLARAINPNEFSKAAAPIEAAGSPPGYFIRFAFNSIDLTPEYRAHLDRLGEVFRSQAMEGVCIKLVGHTDVVGDPAYNVRLSLARARVVERYLEGVRAIDPARLLAAGQGEVSPIPGMPGAHPLNRRVEILAKARNGRACD